MQQLANAVTRRLGPAVSQLFASNGFGKRGANTEASMNLGWRVAAHAAAAALVLVAADMAMASPLASEARSRNGLIAYTQETNSCDDLGCGSFIWTAQASGRAKRRLECSTARRFGCIDVLPDFAPDGRLLATATGGVSDFTDGRKPKDIVAVRRPRGDVVTRIPQYGRQMTALAWSPDAKQLAVGTDRSIYIVASDGSGEELFRRTRVADLDWSSRGRLAWTNEFGRQVFITNDARTSVRSLPVKATGVAWSPSGRRLAYVTPKNVVRTIGANGRDRQTITRRCTGDQASGLGSGIAWSPDGNQLLCTAGVESTRLIALNVRTGRTRTIVRGTKKLPVTSFDWQRAPR